MGLILIKIGVSLEYRYPVLLALHLLSISIFLDFRFWVSVFGSQISSFKIQTLNFNIGVISLILLILWILKFLITCTFLYFTTKTILESSLPPLFIFFVRVTMGKSHMSWPERLVKCEKWPNGLSTVISRHYSFFDTFKCHVREAKSP